MKPATKRARRSSVRRRGAASKKAPPRPAKSLDGLKQEILSSVGRALDLAESDPQAFRTEAKRVARKLGVTIEDVYRTVRVDPSVTRETIGNALLQQLAKAIKKEIGG